MSFAYHGQEFMDDAGYRYIILDGDALDWTLISDDVNDPLGPNLYVFDVTGRMYPLSDDFFTDMDEVDPLASGMSKIMRWQNDLADAAPLPLRKD